MAAGLALWLCLVAVSMTANAMLPTPLPPDKDIITSCAAVSCLKGLECRIVIHQSDSIGPLCLDPKKIPSDGEQKVCGSTGHPLLVAVEKRKRRSAALKSTRYKVFKCNEVCSALHLQLINGVCCADVGVCGMPKDPGPCKALMPRYYYDADQTKCLKFNYGGCEGNRNNFKTLQSCQDVCDDYVCKLKQDPGPCRGFFPTYYYDADLKACHKFVYGGCQGNQNNFETLQRCQDTCLAVPTCHPKCPRGTRCDRTQIACLVPPCPPTPRCVPIDMCLLPKDPGPCEAIIPRFYYDSNLNDCRPFDYGGCQGNANRFETRHDCQSACAERLWGGGRMPGKTR